MLVEAMRAEWGCSLREAMFSESLTAALVLWPSLMARHGATIHFDHGDKARQAGKERMRDWIAKHFVIDPAENPAPGAPWRILDGPR